MYLKVNKHKWNKEYNKQIYRLNLKYLNKTLKYLNKTMKGSVNAQQPMQPRRSGSIIQDTC